MQEMLAMGLDKYLDELMEISSRAAKEFSLEKVQLVSTTDDPHANPLDLFVVQQKLTASM